MLALTAAQLASESNYNSQSDVTAEFLPSDVSCGAELVQKYEMFDSKYDGCTFYCCDHEVTSDVDELAYLAKKRTSPDIYTEREMRGPEWDEPKLIEVSTLLRMGAITKICADDPMIKGWRVVDTMFTGRDKRNADREVIQRKGRCVLRGDLHKHHYDVDGNQRMAPVVRNTSACGTDAVSALRKQHCCSFDVPSAYLWGEQTSLEQVVARPPMGFREYDENGVEILWLMNGPLYGQADAGAIWNRTFG